MLRATKHIAIAVCLAVLLGLCGCAEHSGCLGPDASRVGPDGKVSNLESSSGTQDVSAHDATDEAHTNTSDSAQANSATPLSSEDATDTNLSPADSETTPNDNQGTTGSISLDAIPAYSGELSVEINGGKPFFTEEDRSRGPFEEYSPLDELGRAGTAFALISRETMPTEERTDDLTYRPTGWQTDTYDWVDYHFLYNRCHLIAWSLAGEGNNELNLITGTRTLNIEGMRPYEEQISRYVYRTGGSVLYRVTPLFWGDNLVASGLLLEAVSINDGGAGVEFCVYCYNVEPGVSINYATGQSQADGTMVKRVYEPSAEEAAADFVINKNSGVFHYPDCESVAEMREHNKIFFQGTLEELQAQYPAEEGFRLCNVCRSNHGG